LKFLVRGWLSIENDLDGISGKDEKIIISMSTNGLKAAAWGAKIFLKQ